MAGRPTDYTNEIAAEICASIACGNSLRKVCDSEDMPAASTVFGWLTRHPDFVEQYTRAKEESGDADQDKLDEIAEKVLTGVFDPQAARVAADIIKWSASKKKPKKYGDRQTIEHEVSDNLVERLQRGRKRANDKDSDS